MAETYAQWQAQTRYATWQQIAKMADGPGWHSTGYEQAILDMTQAICEGLPVLSDTEVEQEAQRCAVELLRNRVQQLEAAIALHVDACAKPIAFDTELEAQREAALVEASEGLYLALRFGWPWT